ncbi:MAG: aminomethyl-transferring glycine dehydrogenase [Proteobacteria bacterium]|nr:MAG: aminomethyl-transferring glycine dehydrogenase [Pseudomonadota bacterium]
MPFIPHTRQDQKYMLDTIGVDSVADLFDEIPSRLLCDSLEGVPAGHTEMEMLRLMQERADQDAGALCFLGAGAYEHHIPGAVWDIATRGEFMTAYTPYQAEASQGTLQLVYEYQSMMAALTGMDASNASLYDGASALAEAVLMAIRANRKSKSRQVLSLGTVHPTYRKVLKGIVGNQGISVVDLPVTDELCVDMQELKAREGEDFAALVISQPNYFGSLEQVDELTDWARQQGWLVIAVVNPMSLAMLKPPGEWGTQGVDICVGDGQPLGIPMASGGPYFGFICCRQKLVRQMPGRIIGKTVDSNGKEGYTLTLQAREQHIRRSKATSNICTNQGLAVTAATIYMSLLGAQGLLSVASSCHENTRKLRSMLARQGRVKLLQSADYFHEFVIQLPVSARLVLEHMAERGVIAGCLLEPDYPELPNAILVCVTETKNENDLAIYVEALALALDEVESNAC